MFEMMLVPRQVRSDVVLLHQVHDERFHFTLRRPRSARVDVMVRDDELPLRS